MVMSKPSICISLLQIVARHRRVYVDQVDDRPARHLCHSPICHWMCRTIVCGYPPLKLPVPRVLVLIPCGPDVCVLCVAASIHISEDSPALNVQPVERHRVVMS